MTEEHGLFKANAEAYGYSVFDYHSALFDRDTPAVHVRNLDELLKALRHIDVTTLMDPLGVHGYVLFPMY